MRKNTIARAVAALGVTALALGAAVTTPATAVPTAAKLKGHDACQEMPRLQ